jgi:rare lipoprotein A
VRRAAFAFGIVVLAGCAGSPALDEALSGAKRPEASPARTPAEPLYARRGGERDPTRDGPPIGGPSRAELLRVPDAVPSPEPRSRYGNPHTYVVFGQRYRTLPSSRGYVERGIASWYGRKFHKRLTSNREPYDMFAMTAAHRSLPLPTYVRVTHLENGASAVVRVNDRGPFHPGRIIDLSYTAAVKLGIADAGSGPVEVRAIELGGDGRARFPPRVAPEPVRYFVQLGAYTSEGNATKAYTLAERLRPGLASVRWIEKENRIVHRVRIGPLSGPDETDRVLDRLNAEGVRNARVVIEAQGEDTEEDDNATSHS